MVQVWDVESEEPEAETDEEVDTDSDNDLLEHEVAREIELQFGGPNGNLTKKMSIKHW